MHIVRLHLPAGLQEEILTRTKVRCTLIIHTRTHSGTNRARDRVARRLNIAVRFHFDSVYSKHLQM